MTVETSFSNHSLFFKNSKSIKIFLGTCSFIAAFIVALLFYNYNPYGSQYFDGHPIIGGVLDRTGKVRMKIKNNFSWASLDSKVYQSSMLLTEDSSSASINLDGSTLDIEPNSIIGFERSPDGKIILEIYDGSIAFQKQSDSVQGVKLGDNNISFSGQQGQFKFKRTAGLDENKVAVLAGQAEVNGSQKLEDTLGMILVGAPSTLLGLSLSGSGGGSGGSIPSIGITSGPKSGLQDAQSEAPSSKEIEFIASQIKLDVVRTGGIPEIKYKLEDLSRKLFLEISDQDDFQKIQRKEMDLEGAMRLIKYGMNYYRVVDTNNQVISKGETSWDAPKVKLIQKQMDNGKWLFSWKGINPLKELGYHYLVELTNPTQGKVEALHLTSPSFELDENYYGINNLKLSITNLKENIKVGILGAVKINRTLRPLKLRGEVRCD